MDCDSVGNQFPFVIVLELVTMPHRIFYISVQYSLASRRISIGHFASIAASSRNNDTMRCHVALQSAFYFDCATTRLVSLCRRLHASVSVIFL